MYNPIGNIVLLLQPFDKQPVMGLIIIFYNNTVVIGLKRGTALHGLYFMTGCNQSLQHIVILHIDKKQVTMAIIIIDFP